MKNRTLKVFLRGIGSTMDVHPTSLRVAAKQSAKKRRKAVASDRAALRGDYSQIGLDMHKAWGLVSGERRFK